MTDKPSLIVLDFNLKLELHNLAVRAEAIERLLKSGDAGDAAQLQADITDGSARIMALSKVIEEELNQQGRAESANLFNSQLRELLAVPSQLGDAKLRSVEKAMSLPAGATIDSLRSDVNTAIEQQPSEMEHVWKMAFVVGLATIGAAAGAPLAAAATQQAIGQQVLEDAISAFIAATLLEGSLELREHHNNHRPHQPDDVGEREEVEPSYIPAAVFEGLIPVRVSLDGRRLSAADQMADEHEENTPVRTANFDPRIYDEDDPIPNLEEYAPDLEDDLSSSLEIPSDQTPSPAEQDLPDRGDFYGFSR